jgi:ATP-dependent Lon protease
MKIFIYISTIFLSLASFNLKAMKLEERKLSITESENDDSSDSDFLSLASFNLKAMELEERKLSITESQNDDSSDSDEENEDIQQKKTQQKQIRWNHRKNVWYRRVVALGSAAVPIAIGSIITYYCQSNPNFITFSGLVAMGFRDKIEGIIKTLQNAITPPREMYRLDDIELRINLNQKLSEKTRKTLENGVDNLRIELCRPNNYGPVNTGGPKLRMERLEKILDLPTESLKFDMKEVENYCNNLKDYMNGTYDEKLIKQMKLLVFQIVSDSVNSKNSIVKSSHFFLGLPGTGKTTIAKAIAKALGIKVVCLNLSKIEPNDLCGSPNRAFNENQISSAKPGKIAECFLGKDSALNTIIFLDEIHDVLDKNNKNSPLFQSILKRLLDPDSKYIEDDFLGVDIDVSKTIFILAGNRKPDDNEGALLNRMSTYEFPPATPKARELIAAKALGKAKKRFAIKDKFLGSDEDKTYKAILEEDMKNAEKEGVRALQQVIQNYVRFYSSQIQNITDKSEEFDIEEAFKIARSGNL